MLNTLLHSEAACITQIFCHLVHRKAHIHIIISLKEW